jgi:hypothetical protein
VEDTSHLCIKQKPFALGLSKGSGPRRFSFGQIGASSRLFINPSGTQFDPCP